MSAMSVLLSWPHWDKFLKAACTWLEISGKQTLSSSREVGEHSCHELSPDSLSAFSTSTLYVSGLRDKQIPAEPLFVRSLAR